MISILYRLITFRQPIGSLYKKTSSLSLLLHFFRPYPVRKMYTGIVTEKPKWKATKQKGGLSLYSISQWYEFSKWTYISRPNYRALIFAANKARQRKTDKFTLGVWPGICVFYERGIYQSDITRRLKAKMCIIEKVPLGRRTLFFIW